MKTIKKLQASRKYRLRYVILAAVLLAGLTAVIYTSREVIVLAAGQRFVARISNVTNIEPYRPYRMRIFREYYRYVTFAVPKKHCPGFDHAALNCQRLLRVSSDISANDLQRFEIGNEMTLAHTPLFPDTYVVVDRQGDVMDIIRMPLTMLAITLLALGAVLQNNFGIRLTKGWPPRGRGMRWVAGLYASGLLLLLTSFILHGFQSHVGLVWSALFIITGLIVALAAWLGVRKRVGKRP